MRGSSNCWRTTRARCSTRSGKWRTAWWRCCAAASRSSILAETEVAAQRSLTLANVGYREGFSDFQRVLDAQDALLRTQQQLVAARSTTVSSAIGIYRALGGGWEIRRDTVSSTQATRDTMQKRVDWGDLLQPTATEPPLKGQGGGWPPPDW